MKYSEFVRGIELAAPGCHVEMNGEGELVVYTGWTLADPDEENPHVRRMTDEEIISGVEAPA